MKSDNIIQEKSFKFAVRIVKFSKLIRERNEDVLARQILRSGTSIGANIEEAIGASSQKDFIHKMTISYKEVRETIYWLKLFFHSEIISEVEYSSMYADAEELIKIMTKIINTSKAKTATK